MEKDHNDVKANNEIILTENNELNSTSAICRTCNCRKFIETNHSSVQAQCVDQFAHDFSGLVQPNFCELDIITKNEKIDTAIKFFPAQVTSEVNSFQTVSKILQDDNSVIKRTRETFDEEMKEKCNESLYLQKNLKCSNSVSDGMLERNVKIESRNRQSNKIQKYENEKNVEKMNTEKVSKNKRLVKSNNSGDYTSFIDNREIVRKYDNLVKAKTMYFVNLPNKDDSLKSKRESSNLQIEIEKVIVDAKRNIQISADENESNGSAAKNRRYVSKTDCFSKSVITNKIKNDFSQWNDRNSQSTLYTIKDRTLSEISVGDLIYSNKRTNSQRIHNTSPTSDVATRKIMETVDERSRKGNQKKRHENSKRTSTDEDEGNKLKMKIKNFSRDNDNEKSQNVSTENHTYQIETKNIKSEKDLNKVENNECIPDVLEQKIQDQNNLLKNKSYIEKSKVDVNQRKRKNSKKQRHLRSVNLKKNNIPERKPLENENECPFVTKSVNENERVKSENNESQVKVTLKDGIKKRYSKKRSDIRRTNQAESPKDLEGALTINRKQKNFSISKVSDKMLGQAKRNEKNSPRQTSMSPKSIANGQLKENSILKLYSVDKLPPSTSSFKLTDDLLLKLKTEKRKNMSSKSKSKQQPVSASMTESQLKKPKRSKSQDTEGKYYNSKTQHRSQVDVEQQRSKKSTSDLSKKRYVECFDICTSVEGKFEYQQKSSKIGKIKSDKLCYCDTVPLYYEKKARLNLSNATFRDNLKKYSGKDSYWREETTENFSRETVQKENRNQSKYYAQKGYEFVSRHSEEDNKTKSDTSVNRRNPESRRSKSLIMKERTRSNQNSVSRSLSKEKLYEELRKLGMYHNTKSRDRFRVTSKKLNNKNSNTINNDNMASNVGTPRKYKLKPLPSSETEKEAILNLPIFKRTAVKSADQNISNNDIRQQKQHEMKMKNTLSSRSSEDEALISLDDKCSNRKLNKKSVCRREVSFTHLNVTPVQDLYRKRSKISISKTLLPPEIAVIERANLAINKNFKLQKKDEKHLQQPILFKKNISDGVSETCNRKLSFFHIASGEKILEISMRATSHDGNASIGFTVSGTEPPKRLRCGYIGKPVSEKTCKLHMTFFPSVEVSEQNSDFENKTPDLNCSAKKEKEIVLAEVKANREDIIKIVKETPSLFTSAKNVKKKNTSSLIKHRISKLRSCSKHNFRRNVTSLRPWWKMHIHKVTTSKLTRPIKVETINSRRFCNKHQNKCERKEENEKERCNQMKSYRFRKIKEKYQRKSNLSRTLNLLESTLQIIKEESYSTDSSRCRSCKAEKPETLTDIKNTQTDLENHDIVKMKEVINYLYNAIDQNKELNSKSEKYLQTDKYLCSSTETSSYEERYQNATKNQPIKKIIKSSNQKANEVRNSGSVQNVKVNKEERKECKLNPTVSSSYENISSTSNTKSLSTEKSSSAEVLSSSYFQKYKATKALIDSKRKDKCDRAALTTIESNLSTIDKSVTPAEKLKIDKNVGTNDIASNDVLGSQEQSESGKQIENQLSSSFIIEQAVKHDDEMLSKTHSTSTKVLKKFEDKSLQTSDYIFQAEINPKTNIIYDCLYTEKNSSNSDNIAIVEKISKRPKEKMKRKKLIKSHSTFERLKRVFGPKQKYIQNKVTAYSMSEKLDSDVNICIGQQPTEMNYENLIKFEKHLKQVLGLYPSIFKTIRAHMGVTFPKNPEKVSNLFHSKSTLATTVDTVTEYKNTECYENTPPQSNNNINDCLDHCCNCYHVWHKKYIVEQYNSQNFNFRSEKHGEKNKMYRKKIKENRMSKHGSSSSLKSNTHRVPKHLKKNRMKSKSSKQISKQNEIYSHHSVTSVYSNDKGFESSCSSISLNEKWSVASPLYGRTTSSDDLSVTAQDVATERDTSKSNQCLNLNQMTVPSVGRKSKSLIEVSTKKSVNRKVILKQILNFKASVREQNNIMQIFSDEYQPNILLMSVSSSCTVFTTPSKFLTKVEKHLQFEKAPPAPEMATKAVGEDLVTTEIKNKSKIDEKIYRNILFPNAHEKACNIPKDNRQKPFYIHKISENNSDQELDSLENKSVVQAKNDEEDFSTDSLEVIKCPPKSCNYNMLYASTTFVKPTNQTYLVYSNTVEYDKKISKQIDRERHNNERKSSKNRKTDETDKKRSTGVKDTGQNVSNSLISESGYESNKSKRTASIRNFFKKGGSLLDMFRSSTKTTAKTQKGENYHTNETSVSNFTSFSNLFTKRQGQQTVTKKDAETSVTKTKSSGPDIENTSNKVYWRNISKDKKVSKHEKKATNYNSMQTDDRNKETDPKNKNPEFKPFPSSSLSFPLKTYRKQKDECRAYAEKVFLESQLRKEGYYKQYKEFKEMPLELLIGKKIPCKSKCKQQQSFARAPPKSNQTEATTKEINSPHVLARQDFELGQKFAPKAFVTEEKIIFQSDETKMKPVINVDGLEQDALTHSFTLNTRYKKEVRFNKDAEETKPLLLSEKLLPVISKNSLTSTKRFDALYKLEHENNIVDTSQFRFASSPGDSISRTSEESSSIEFHELVTRCCEHRNNNTEFAQSEPQFPETSKSKNPDESFELHTSARSKTLEGTKLKYFVDTSESDRSSKLHFAKLDLKSPETTLRQLKPSRSHELHGHQNSIVNLLETEFSLKSREHTPENFKRSSDEPKEFIQFYTRTSEPHESTVAIAEISKIRLKSDTPEDSKSKSSKRPSKARSKSSNTSSSRRKSKCTEEEMMHNCRCSVKIPETVKTPDTVITPDTIKTLDAVTKKESQEKGFDKEPDGLETAPIVSSIVDIIVSKSVIEAIDTENVSKEQIDEQEKLGVASAEAPQDLKRNVSDDFRKGLTDKEVFEKLLDSYEKKDSIATRLSKDDDFFNSQIDFLRKQSDETFGEQNNLVGRSSKIYADDRHRSTHFWEEKIRQMRTKEDNPVKADEIGICFARGFRPDNITLSGDACFNLNKQDRMIFTDKTLSDQESIIDFSERETPLDYLLALGFMVDEASNALKDEDIRSRLLAAITEARVWVNKITTTQGTLLYLVAYKSRPKTMRYFLQLVEAIINRRINNAIKLDGFLRILEQVEEGEIQMINILGSDKFEDEENEEKIVRKQLKQLFITVYKIAERESIQMEKPLSQESILLLRILAAKYRAGLHPHLELIARYIGQELLTTETQLEAAMIFLSRLDTAEVKLKEFEAYCDIRCEKKKKTEKKSEPTVSEKTASKK